MSPLARLVNGAERVLGIVERALLVAILTGMLSISVAIVVARYVPWVSGVSRYFDLMVGMMPWVAMVGIAVAMQRGRHAGFSLVVDSLGSRGRWISSTIALIATGVFVAVLIWGGVALVQSQLESGLTVGAARLPAWWFSLSVPVGASLTLFHLVAEAVRSWTERGSHQADAGVSTASEEET